MNLRKTLTSPVFAMSGAYVYLSVIGIVLWMTGFYKGNNFFNWGPPITFFNHDIESEDKFYILHAMIFVHQLVNNWINTVVYPWIINEIQDPKARTLRYNTVSSLLLINFFNFYSELDVMIILMGFTSQISFLITVTIANIISSTIINHHHIMNKTVDHHSALLHMDDIIS